MENTKIRNTANVIDRILKIIQSFLVAGVIVSGIFIVLTAIFGEKVVASASTLKLGGLALVLEGSMTDYLDVGKIRVSIMISLIAAALVCAVSWYCLKLLRKILSPMKEGRPFDAGISNGVRSLARAVLVGGAAAV